MDNHSTRSWWLDVGLLTLIIGIVNFCFLGSAPLFTPDEARYVEIPREMLLYHRFIVPHLDGIIYFEKPALYYWIVAGAIKLFGFGEWATRSCPAVFGLCGCLITYLTARCLFNRRVGVLSALVLSSSLLYFSMSHLITLDMPLTFFLTACLYSFLIAMQHPDGIKRKLWLWLAYLCSGLAIMTKGLIGLAFPGLIVLIWFAALGRWSTLKNICLVSGILIIFAINLPWLLAVQAQQPAFLHFYLIDQQFARYATPIADRHMAALSYIGVFLVGLFPWITLLPQSIKCNFPHWRERTRYSNNLFLLIWPTVIFLFFAFSHSILIPYLLPTLPPLAIVIANYLDKAWQEIPDGRQRLSIAIFSCVCVILAIGLVALPHFQALGNPDGTRKLLTVIAAIFVIGASIALLGAYRWPLSRTVTTMLITSYLSFILIWVAAPYVNTRSIKPLALQIVSIMKQYPDAEIINYGNYHQDLPYYTQHLVTIVDWQNELTFGLHHQADAKSRLIDDAAFWQLWQSQQRLYVVMSQRSYKQLLHGLHKPAYLIGQTLNDVLVTNKDPSS